MENTTTTLPHEHIIETLILPKLPLKSLSQFKLVSKQWNSFISSKYFINLHLQNLTNYSHLQSQLYTLHINNNNNEPPKTKTITCIHMHNSLTNQNNFLLGSSQNAPSHTFPGPNSPKHTVLHSGFGFDTVSEDHKIVLIVKENKSSKPLAYVLSLKTNFWQKRDLSCVPPKFKDCFMVPSCRNFAPTLVNNSLHWVIGSRHLGRVLLMFDLALETFTVKPLCDKDDDDVYPILLVKFGDNCATVGRGRETCMYQELSPTTMFMSRTRTYKRRSGVVELYYLD